MINELNIFRSIMYRANGKPIIDNLPIFVADYLFPIQNPCVTENYFVSDSSSSYAYIYNHCDNSFARIYEFPPDIKESSSGYRELMAIVYTLTCNDLSMFSNSNALWSTDSTTVYFWMSRGSKIPFVQRQLLTIKQLEIKYNFTLKCSWLPRSNPIIVRADEGSKLAMSTDV